MKTFAEIAFTPAVQALQEADGSRSSYARLQAESLPADGLGDREARYLAAADSFYLATVGEGGWPYVQHRGGPAGFLKVISPTRIAFADFRGNRQLVSAGNASKDDRVSLIIMDYANRQRLKILARLRFLSLSDAEPALVSAVSLPGYRAPVERIAVMDVQAFEWNCPQHITERFTLDQIEASVKPLRERIIQLEAEVNAPGRL